MDDYSGIFDLTGRRALVIGGASGIGRAACFGLASFGAQVICGDVKTDQAKETAEEIRKGGQAAEAVPIDLCMATASQPRRRERARPMCSSSRRRSMCASPCSTTPRTNSTASSAST